MIRGLRVPVHLTSRDSLRILDLAEIWAARTGQQIRLVSANDHVHTRRSAHYLGLALDFHSSDPDGLAAMLRRAGYRVLWKVPGHYAHVHVEQQGAEDASPRPLAPTRQALSQVSREVARRRTNERTQIAPTINEGLHRLAKRDRIDPRRDLAPTIEERD